MTKWRAIALATLVVVPAYWAILAGVVTLELDDGEGLAEPLAAVTFGLAVIPFAYLVLAVMSEQRHVPSAVVRAVGLAVVIGIPLSAATSDVVTGLVAGIGAGGIAALRGDGAAHWRSRAVGLVLACGYTFVLAHTAAALALLPAPFLCFTVLGLADHLAEQRHERSPARA